MGIYIGYRVYYRGVSQAAGALAARLLHVARGVLRCGGAAAQALAGAEAAYTRALTAASRVALAGDCDGAALYAAAAGLADLPFQVGQQHAAIGAGLSDTTRAVQARGPPRATRSAAPLSTAHAPPPPRPFQPASP